MTIREAIKIYSAVEIDLLLGHVLSKPREFLLLNPDYRVSTTQIKKLAELAKRKQNGEPIAYLLGYKYFYGLKFLVNKSVLIPRPESEWLVERGLKYIKTRPGKSLKVLDMGTGSGSLIIGLAAATTRSSGIMGSHTTSSSINWFASDVSAAALKVAKENSRLHKTLVKFLQRNLFANLPGKFDLILANLPYVPASDYKKLLAGLKHEPKLALTDGTNSSVLIEKFLRQVGPHLTARGLILMEIDPSSAAIMRKAAKESKLPFKLSFYKDLRGLTRYAAIKKLLPV
jgi:release factor glutamine methyltransferase